MTKPRFVYFGTPEFSTYVLDELAAASFTPVLVVTTPDRLAGRGLMLQESPVKKWAVARTIPVLQPETFDETALTALQEADADLFIVAAYGKILPRTALSIAKCGNVNVHPSLLPRYRGTSPVESQILADDEKTGVSVIVMDEKMDHGPILAKEEITFPNWPVGRNVMNDRLWRAGGVLLAASLPEYLSGALLPKEQEHEAATFTKKLSKEDGLLDMDAPGRENYLKYLAYEGWPGTFFYADIGGAKTRVKIKTARFENGAFIPELVIPEGRGETDYASLL
jgi:methionyl-tRNA formyltransferase